MQHKREIGVSIISLIGFSGVSLPGFFLQHDSLGKVASFAIRNDIAVQLLPLAIASPFSFQNASLLTKFERLKVVSCEGWWGSPWQQLKTIRGGKEPLSRRVKGLVASLLFFPFCRKRMERILRELLDRFPNALLVDITGPNSALEVSTNNQPDHEYWINQAKRGQSLVWDTYHAQHFNISPTKLLQALLENGAQINLIHVQWNSTGEIEEFLKSNDKTTQSQLELLSGTRCPVVIEVKPGAIKDFEMFLLIQSKIRDAMNPTRA